MSLLQVSDIIAKLVALLAALFSIVYTFGVVWRVEKRLDISYKLFLVAIIFFTLACVLSYFNTEKGIVMSFLVNLNYGLFSLFFLAGICTMRSLIRKIDGE
jgi:hypothetical protein